MIKYKGSTLWNKLPKELKEIKSRQYFKDSLKTTFLEIFSALLINLNYQIYHELPT